MHGGNREAEIENRFVDTVREGEGGADWESSTEAHMLACVKGTDGGRLLPEHGELNLALCDNLEVGTRWWVGGGSKVEGHMYTDSRCCTAEVCTML